MVVHENKSKRTSPGKALNKDLIRIAAITKLW
jgi:hypothetical protein